MHRPVHLVAALCVVAVYMALLVAAGFSPMAAGRLADGDAYMWLMRVRDLYFSGDWYGAANLQTDAPLGETLHWTRPFDLILLAGAFAGSLVTDFHSALWAWGMVVSPVLLMLAVPVWSWGTRPFLSGGQFVLSLALVFLLWRVGLAFEPARPDHHGFLGLLFLAVLAGLLRLSQDEDDRVALVAGAVAGLALWASIESLILVVYGGAALALFWVVGWHGRAGLVLRFLGAATALVLLGLAVQRPPALWLTERYAQLAAPHGWLMICATLAWAAVARVQGRLTDWRGRLGAAAVAGAVVAAAMAAVYPTFFAGPWVDYDVAMVKEWLPTIDEFTPLWPTDRDTLSHFLLEAGPVVLAFGWCVAARGRLGVLLGLGIALYLPLALREGRWMVYGQMLALLPWALMISQAWRRAGQWPAMAARIGGRAAAVLVLALGPMVAAGALRASGPVAAKANDAACDWVDMAVHLRGLGAPIVMSHSFAGPELAWWGHLRVVTTSYGHDNIKDGWAFFRSADDGIGRAIAEARGVDYVLVCPTDGEAAILGRDDPASLYAALAQGRPPRWLAPVDLPQTLAGFRLYRVTR